MVVAKRQGREKPIKIEQGRSKEGPRTGVRTSGGTNSTPGWPSSHSAGPGRRVHTAQAQGGGQNTKRGAKGPELSLLFVFGSACPRGCIFLLFSK